MSSAVDGPSSASAPAGRRMSGWRTGTGSPGRPSGWPSWRTTSRSSPGCSSPVMPPTKGEHASVHDAIHLPKGLQVPRIPIMVGGNGPKVTWRLAARYADELNLDALMPDEVAVAMPVIAERCAEIGRDPASLRVSVFLWGRPAAVAPGRERRDLLRQYEEPGPQPGHRPGLRGGQSTRRAGVVRRRWCCPRLARLAPVTMHALRA